MEKDRRNKAKHPALSANKHRKRTPTIGILGDNLYDIPRKILKSVITVADQHGFKSLYFKCDALSYPGPPFLLSNIFYNFLNPGILDGIIVTSNLLATLSSPREFRKFLDRYHPLPLVSLGLAFDGIPSIVPENTGGIYTAVYHLIKDHQLRKIAFLKGPDKHPDAIERFNAYVQAMKDNHCIVDPELILEGNFQAESGEEAVAILLDERGKIPGQDVEAIVCCNDYMALGVIIELQNRDIRIPEEIALVSFDDMPSAYYLTPSLSTVSLRFDEMAAKATEMLISTIRGESVPLLTVQNSEFIHRNSCGCSAELKTVTKSQLYLETASLPLTSPRQFLQKLNWYAGKSTIRYIRIWNPILNIISKEDPLEKEKSKNSDVRDILGDEKWISLGSTINNSLNAIVFDRFIVELGVALTSTLELTEQLDILRHFLPRIGVTRCCLCLYEDPEKVKIFDVLPPRSRLILAFTEERQVDLPAGGIKFPTEDLIPDEIIETIGWQGWVILPLYFHQESLGYLLLDNKVPDESVYYFIRGQFSGAIKGSLLLKESQLRAKKLSRANKTIREFNEKLKIENLRFKTEMELARNIQTTLLPKTVRNVHPDFEIAAGMLPAEEVGGDYYDIALDKQGSLWLGIGDVSGHGLKPGLIMMLAQTVHTTITTTCSASPAETIGMINEVMIKNVTGRMHENNYMTCVLLHYRGDGRFLFAGMHLDLLVYRQSTGKCETIETRGMWLNVLPDINALVSNRELYLEIGDILVLFTDGISEAINKDDEMLRTEGLSELVALYCEKEIDDMHNAIIADVLSWNHGNQDDDLSLVIARRIR